MSSLAVQYLTALYDLTELLAPYLLLGIFLSAFIKTYIRKEWILSHLKSNRFVSVLKACLIGIPLPICSCGVMPIAHMLSKMGSSRASILSFLISTPMSGVDAIVVYSAVFGGAFAAISVGTAFVSALLAGGIAYLLQKQLSEPSITNTHFGTEAMPLFGSPSSLLSSLSQNAQPKATYLSSSFVQGAKESIDDLVKPLFFGVLLAGAIEVFFGSFITVTEYYWLNFLLIPIIAVPMYVCSISVIPVALSLYAIGFSEGMVFSFILIAPCVSLINLSLLVSFLSKKELFVLLGSVIFVAMGMGALIDIGFGVDVMLSLTHAEHTNASSSFVGTLEMICAIILVVLFASVYAQKQLLQITRKNK